MVRQMELLYIFSLFFFKEENKIYLKGNKWNLFNVEYHVSTKINIPPIGDRDLTLTKRTRIDLTVFNFSLILIYYGAMYTFFQPPLKL